MRPWNMARDTGCRSYGLTKPCGESGIGCLAYKDWCFRRFQLREPWFVVQQRIYRHFTNAVILWSAGSKLHRWSAGGHSTILLTQLLDLAEKLVDIATFINKRTNLGSTAPLTFAVPLLADLAVGKYSLLRNGSCCMADYQNNVSYEHGIAGI